MKHSIALLALAFSLNATADCPAALPTMMPVAADGYSASLDAMHSSRAAVAGYVQTIENYLSCQDRLLSDARHDELVEQAEEAAGTFNVQLQHYRQSQNSVAKN